MSRGIVAGDPFVSIDREGVGELMRIGVERGRATRRGLKIGICGEHGGDPASVAFCHEIGLDYVSCSPFRVPIARLAAAQAVIGKAANSDWRIGLLSASYSLFAPIAGPILMAILRQHRAINAIARLMQQ